MVLVELWKDGQPLGYEKQVSWFHLMHGTLYFKRSEYDPDEITFTTEDGVSVSKPLTIPPGGTWVYINYERPSHAPE